jgi:hypothetical protein
VRSNFRTIPVVDSNGDQLTLYEFRDRSSSFRLVPRKRFELCTGEAVRKEGNCFVVEATGEKLARVKSSS